MIPERCTFCKGTLQEGKIDAVMKDVHSGRLCCRPLAAGGVDLTR
ncbi:hypothetical protein [Methanoculleus receptaculi]|uniref:Uncharacterized protein n=1 Tax=Methanoculleus receptaculi TaxID=394967 RepID=A0AAX4FT03_9EURY|nr:hypothetical protein [Methanoculleus receptaculi]WOX57053.1 hypothetical protein R6Y96_06990 [Methanoculleus receptaculi]